MGRMRLITRKVRPPPPKKNVLITVLCSVINLQSTPNTAGLEPLTTGLASIALVAECSGSAVGQAAFAFGPSRTRTSSYDPPSH